MLLMFLCLCSEVATTVEKRARRQRRRWRLSAGELSAGDVFEIWNVDRTTLEDLHLVASDQRPVGADGREIVTSEPGLSARVYNFNAGAADDAECAAAQLGFNVRMLQNSSKTLEPVVIFQQRQGSHLENLRLAVGSP